MLRSVDEHIYGGKFFRPQPLLIQEPESLTVVTVWGRSDEALAAALKGPQADESLAEHAQSLHLQIREWGAGSTGIELITLRKTEGDLIEWWACGQPALILSHGDKNLVLHQALDFNFDSAAEPAPAPLPSALIGSEELLPAASTGSFRLQKGQKIVLLSRSWVPAAALSSLMDREECARALAHDAEDMPFWWGLFESE